MLQILDTVIRIRLHDVDYVPSPNQRRWRRKFLLRLRNEDRVKWGPEHDGQQIWLLDDRFPNQPIHD